MDTLWRLTGGRVRLGPLSNDYLEHCGLSSLRLASFFDQIERNKLQVNSFILLQSGHVVARMFRAPYRPDCPQILFSLSKSFTSVAVGIAVDSGYFHLDDPVISFFPERCPKRISTNLEKMTIHHLLSMNTGHRSNIYTAVTGEKDWVRSFLCARGGMRAGESLFV
jgi:CubicO group peptidase (beta-lactamase class C family)